MKPTNRILNWSVVAIYFLTTSVYGQIGDQPKEDQDLYSAGKALYNEKRYQEAISLFNQVKSEAILSLDTVTLMNTLSRLGLCYLQLEKFSTSAKYYHDALNAELKYGDTLRMAKAFNNVGISKYYLSEFDSCIFYYEKALSFYKLKKHGRLPAFVKNLGLVYQKTGRYDAAARHLFESAKSYEDQANLKEAASIYNIIGNMFNESGNDSLALTYHKMSLDIRRKINDEMKVAQSLSNLGNVVQRSYGVDSALSLYSEALSISERYDYGRLRSAILNNLGEIYLKKGQIVRSKAAFKESLSIKRELEDRHGIAYTTHNLARLALEKNELNEAEKYITDGLAISRQIQSATLLLKYYALYALLLTSQDKYEEAIAYYKTYHDLKDSLLSEVKLKAFSEAEVKYRTDKLEAEVASLRPLEKELKILNLQAQNQEEQLKFHRMMNWTVGSISVMMLILIVLVIRVGKQRKRINDLLALQNDEINHRVKNNLGILMAIFSGQSRAANNREVKSVLKQNEHRIKVIRHLHARLSNEPSEDVSTKVYLEGLIDDLLFSFNYSKSNAELIIENLRIDTDKILHIGLLLNELITNALKYGLQATSKPLLRVVAKAHDKFIQLEVGDNGPGLQNDQLSKENKTYGMSLINKLVKRQLNGKLHYQYDQGAVFQIEIPI